MPKVSVEVDSVHALLRVENAILMFAGIAGLGIAILITLYSKFCCHADSPPFCSFRKLNLF